MILDPDLVLYPILYLAPVLYLDLVLYLNPVLGLNPTLYLDQDLYLNPVLYLDPVLHLNPVLYLDPVLYLNPGSSSVSESCSVPGSTSLLIRIQFCIWTKFLTWISFRIRICFHWPALHLQLTEKSRPLCFRNSRQQYWTLGKASRFHDILKWFCVFKKQLFATKTHESGSVKMIKIRGPPTVITFRRQIRQIKNLITPKDFYIGRTRTQGD